MFQSCNEYNRLYSSNYSWASIINSTLLHFPLNWHFWLNQFKRVEKSGRPSWILSCWFRWNWFREKQTMLLTGNNHFTVVIHFETFRENRSWLLISWKRFIFSYLSFWNWLVNRQRKFCHSNVPATWKIYLNFW